MNKRGSLSTLLFVILVFIVCLVSLFAFAKHRNIIIEESIGINSINEAKILEEVTSLELRNLGDQAIFYAYNQTIQRLSYDFSVSGYSKSYFIFDKITFSNQKYKTIFEEEFNKRFQEITLSYPSSEEKEKIVKSALDTTIISFDGENIILSVDFNVLKEGSNGVNVTFSKKIYYNSTLTKFNLTNLNTVATIWDICPPTLKSRLYCITTTFPGFNFAPFPEGYFLVNSTKSLESRFLIKLYSNKQYFTGSEELSRFQLYFAIPVNEAQQDFLQFPINVGKESFVLPEFSSEMYFSFLTDSDYTPGILGSNTPQLSE